LQDLTPQLTVPEESLFVFKLAALADATSPESLQSDSINLV